MAGRAGDGHSRVVAPVSLDPPVEVFCGATRSSVAGVVEVDRHGQARRRIGDGPTIARRNPQDDVRVLPRGTVERVAANELVEHVSRQVESGLGSTDEVVPFGRDAGRLHPGGGDDTIDRSRNGTVAMRLGPSPSQRCKVGQNGMRTKPRPEAVDLAPAHPWNSDAVGKSEDRPGVRWRQWTATVPRLSTTVLDVGGVDDPPSRDLGPWQLAGVDQRADPLSAHPEFASSVEDTQLGDRFDTSPSPFTRELFR